MITMETVHHFLTGEELAESLVQKMAEEFADFAEAQTRYQATMRTLRQELGENAVPSVDEEISAIKQQTVSHLLFSGVLGIKANLDHFIDPVARNFLDTDSETYLREATARRLPEYERAQHVREQFYAQLSQSQRELYQNVQEYVSHLETVGPKLAHYYGFILANDLLPRIVPGYHPDPVLTRQYRTALNKYMGKPLV